MLVSLIPLSSTKENRAAYGAIDIRPVPKEKDGRRRMGQVPEIRFWLAFVSALSRWEG
jgi:hypothetical protein